MKDVILNLLLQKAYAQPTPPTTLPVSTWDWERFIPINMFVGDINTLIVDIIRIFLIAAGLVALIYLIVGGYQYATAGGNADQAAAARQTILNAIIGVVIVFASYAIITWFMEKFVR